MQCCPNKLIYIKTNFFLHLGVNSLFVNMTWENHISFLLWNKSSYNNNNNKNNNKKNKNNNNCSEISQLYLHFWCKTLNIFCHWKMVKNIYEINQHWTGHYAMKCCLNKLIYIKLCLNNNFSNFIFVEAQYLATNSIVVTQG